MTARQRHIFLVIVVVCVVAIAAIGLSAPAFSDFTIILLSAIVLYAFVVRLL